MYSSRAEDCDGIPSSTDPARLLLLSRADRQSFTPSTSTCPSRRKKPRRHSSPLPEKHGVTLETDGDIAPTTGSPALLQQLTTNLVHNAIVHNLPEQDNVWVTTALRPATVVLTVENTGEQLTPERVATLTEPFQRGTEHAHTDHVGIGLGQTIVKTITHAHHGTPTLTPLPAGRLRITVGLPAASVKDGSGAPP